MGRTPVPDRKGATHVHCRFPLVRGRAVEGYVRGSCLAAGVCRLAAATALGVALMALVGAPGALASGQEHDHFRDVFTDVDEDFCGTGQEIDIAGNVLVNEWHSPHKSDFRTTAVGTVTFTNPACEVESESERTPHHAPEQAT